jgi:predicted ATPase
LGYNGSNLPDYLAWFKNTSENDLSYASIHKEMREILPEMDSIIVTQVESGKQGMAMSFQGQLGYRGYIAAPDLSDGTLFTLGILAILYCPRKPSLLCFEEPETGLHPRRLRWLFDKIISKVYPGDNSPSTQILISSHSPLFMDLFGSMPECVQCFSSIEGRSRVNSLLELNDLLHLEKTPDEPIGQLSATGLYDNL